MRIIFMGTPDFAVASLEALIASPDHQVVGVVTQPDKMTGRNRSGGKLQPSPVKVCAEEHKIPVLQPVKIRGNEGFISILRELAPDLIVVAAFGQILPAEVLDLPKYGCINVHASLLPKYRGAAPIQWCILNGEKETGITIMKMDIGLDTGDMILQVKLTISPEETGGSLFDRLAESSGPVLLTAIEKIENGTAEYIPQDTELSCYSPMIRKELGNINWEMPAKTLERYVRGLSPWPGCYTYYGERMIKLWKCSVLEDNFSAKPGTIVKSTASEVVVACGEGALSIQELQLSGKNRMKIDEFQRGNRLEEGAELWQTIRT
ncbi:MAG: methionyl-tRNA formyltransferase [Lachnospiraceae bacterium]|nr:methionyl-tRNA formyltransferase [Lachnospiraceae bacterium]